MKAILQRRISKLAYLIFLFLFACKKEKAPTPNIPSTVSYQNNIRLILQANCTTCHNPGGSGAAAGILLDNYNNTKSVTTLSRSNQNVLLGAIKHLSGFSPMPQGGAKLSNEDILKIESWINAGAPNN